MAKPLRTIIGSALSVTGLAIAAGVSATPAQAATYYAYQNEHSRTCLTGGKTGTVFVSTCNGSWYQQWTTAGGDDAGYYRLKNRATGKCLMTDYKNQVNAVWTSTCSTDDDAATPRTASRTPTWSRSPTSRPSSDTCTTRCISAVTSRSSTSSRR